VVANQCLPTDIQDHRSSLLVIMRLVSGLSYFSGVGFELRNRGFDLARISSPASWSACNCAIRSAAGFFFSIIASRIARSDREMDHGTERVVPSGFEDEEVSPSISVAIFT